MLARQSDLLAARPIISSAVAGVVGSDAFGSLFRRSVLDVHRAVFARDQDTVTLTIADAGTVAAEALRVVRPELADQLEDSGRRRAAQAPDGLRHRGPRARSRRRADPRVRARPAGAGRGRRGDRTLRRPPPHRLAARSGHGARGRRDRHRLHGRPGDRARPRAGPGEPRGGRRRLGRVPRRPAHARLGAGRRRGGHRRGRRLGDPPDRDRGPAAQGMADRDDRPGADGPARRSRRRADRRGRARDRGADRDRAGRRHAGRRVPPVRGRRGAAAARLPAAGAGRRGGAPCVACRGSSCR